MVGVNLSAVVRTPEVGAWAFEVCRVVDVHAPLAIDDDKTRERLVETP